MSSSTVSFGTRLLARTTGFASRTMGEPAVFWSDAVYRLVVGTLVEAVEDSEEEMTVRLGFFSLPNIPKNPDFFRVGSPADFSDFSITCSKMLLLEEVRRDEVCGSAVVTVVVPRTIVADGSTGWVVGTGWACHGYGWAGGSRK